MSETATWQPSAPIPNLLKRAAVMAEIRRFFTDRGVLEVETPCMSQATVTDIHLFPFETRFVGPGHSQGLNLYLMTSPEYHMKRLLAAGCGPVFQLCRSFRNEEMGRHHNPEFTMLEWYRPCYDMYRLINEVDDLLQQVLEAGRNAPTAHNNQPQRIFVLQSPEAMAKADACMGCHFHPPVLLAVAYDPAAAWDREDDGKNHGEIDATIAVTQMMLQAADLGLGTTYVGMFDPEKLTAAFPEMAGLVPIAMLPLGYPAEGAHPARLHTERKPMEQLVKYL